MRYAFNLRARWSIRLLVLPPAAAVVFVVVVGAVDVAPNFVKLSLAGAAQDWLAPVWQ